jgi:branched-chain amino acid transport system substrate-binding protein
MLLVGRRGWALVFCGALALALAEGAGGTTRAADVQPVQIDALVGLTGSAAFAGQATQSTLQALETVANKRGRIRGRPVRFAILDNRTDPKLAVQLANDVIANKSKAMLVSGFVAACKAVEPLVASGPLEYCLSPALYPKSDGFVFSAGTSTRDTTAVFVRYLRERGWDRVTTITSNDASGQDADAQIDAVMGSPENKSLQLVDREHFAPGDLSVSAQIAKIKSANPSVIVVWTSGAPFGAVLRAIQDSGIDVPVMTTNSNMIYRQMKQFAAVLPKALYFPGPPFVVAAALTPAVAARQREFLAAIRQTGGVPDYEGGEAWDPGQLIIDALRHVGPDATPEQIREYIVSLKSWTGIGGIYDFTTGTQRGLGEKDVVIMRWDGAKDWWTGVSGPGGSPAGKS